MEPSLFPHLPRHREQLREALDQLVQRRALGRQELVQRRVERPDDDGPASHLAEDPGEVLALVGFEARESRGPSRRAGGPGGGVGGRGFFAVFLSSACFILLLALSRELRGPDQLAHRADAVGGGEEHVLGADEADSRF